jgi:adenosine deaminase
MVVRLEAVLEKIRRLDHDIEELQRLRSRLPSGREFSGDLQISFDRALNALLEEKASLEELEIEEPPEDLISDIISIDVVTASRMRTDLVRETAELDAREKRLMEFLRLIPKTEIHLHLEACISKETVAGLLQKNQVAFQQEELDKLYKFTNLNEFIKLYLFIIDSIKTPSDFSLVFNSLRTYLEANTIRYAEVFFAPSRMIQNGLHFEDIAGTLDELARNCRQQGGPDVRFLVDVSRTFGPDNASKNLQRVLSCRNGSIIGIGLGGAELMGPARDFKNVFAQARAEGLHAVAHAGEDDGPWSVRETVEILKAERVGHGTSAIQDPDLMKLLKEKQTPIEICLTSNLFTGKYVRQEKDHPVKRYYQEGIICTVNTDDPEIFNVNLTEEYFKYHKHLGFTVTELIDLVRQGVLSSFHPQKHELWNQFRNEIETLRRVHDL